MEGSIRYLATLVCVVACSSSTAVPAPIVPDKLVGRWGSGDMGLVITDTSAAAHFDFCADGTLKVPIFLDPSGRFDTPGTYVRSIGPAIQAKSARYVGLWRPASLTVTVFLSDPIGPTGTEIVGPFDLLPNAAGPPTRPCPIETRAER
jgi:hypothetical protein